MGMFPGKMCTLVKIGGLICPNHSHLDAQVWEQGGSNPRSKQQFLQQPDREILGDPKVAPMTFSILCFDVLPTESTCTYETVFYKSASPIQGITSNHSEFLYFIFYWTNGMNILKLPAYYTPIKINKSIALKGKMS